MKDKKKNISGYKKTKVGWIPKDWELVGGEDICALITKGTTPRVRDNETYTDPVPYLRVQNLSFDGSLLFEQDRLFIERVCHESELARSRLFPGDVLTNIVGPPLGKVSLVPSTFPEWNMNQAIAVFRTKEECCENVFLCHYLQTRRALAWLDGQARKTSGQKNLTLETCRELPIPLPSLPEQEAIAKVLECWDKAIRGYERKIEKKRNIKKGLMQQLLSGKRRLPGFSTTKCTEKHGKKKDGIPEGWKEVTFGSVFSFLKTYAFSREQLTTELIEDSQIYNIHYGDLHATYCGCILNCAAETRIPRLRQSAGLPNDAIMLQEGDIVIADASEDYDGVCAYIELQNVGNKTITGGLHTFAARDKTGETAFGYRGYVLQERSVSKELKRIATGVSVYGVSKTNLAKVRILLPPLPEQQAIAAVLSSVDAEIAALERKLKVLREQKRFLLNNLVTGTIRLPQFVSSNVTEVTTGDAE